MDRILILMSDTGGGHRASAESLEAAFAERGGPGLQVSVVDLWQGYTPWPLNELPKSYKFLVDDAPQLYKLIWETGESRRVMTPVMDVVSRWGEKAICRVLCDYHPDVIIAVHPLLQEAPLDVLARRRQSIPFVTVVTDLATFHPTWFQKEVSLCFVPNSLAYDQALEAGLQPAQLRVFGLPIHPAFSQPPRPKEALRRELGMPLDVPAVLLTSGGEGMGPVAEIAEAVAAHLAADGQGLSRPAGQLVVICGRNDKLQAKLEAAPWPIPTQIKGFVHNMTEWMAASDCIVTKAGPGTIAEAMARGLPMVLSGYIPGQESGNVAYVVDNGIGRYSPDPDEIAAIVGRWFGDERSTMADMAERARHLGRPAAVFDIVDEILRTWPATPPTANPLPSAEQVTAGASGGA
jgi:1,2-diacylglycerol 3-beta-galactosyltransferase